MLQGGNIVVCCQLHDVFRLFIAKSRYELNITGAAAHAA